ncbi:hypothetical protein [Mesorhizobium sp. M0244]|uniref:hypothetical protein n=1 Tax=Mesorhizobium sp. M0244 TaxID=2956926 RepID=UPI003336E4F2
MKKFHPTYSAAFLIVGSGALISRGRYSSYGPIDTAILVLFLIFFWWLISDFSGGKADVDADRRQSADNGIAFPFGKFLSRVFGRGNRSV